MKTKTLVTGANGHLGANLVRDLVEHGYEVVALVREGADVRGLDDVRSDITLAHGDVRDAKAVREAMCGSELVFHTAAPYVLLGERSERRDHHTRRRGHRKRTSKREDERRAAPRHDEQLQRRRLHR